MASNSEYVRAFSHITRDWLQTETSEIGHLLRAGDAYCEGHIEMTKGGRQAW